MRNDFCENYLMHWGIQKGGKRPNAKYFERITLGNGKYRYFYTAAEYNAYMKGRGKTKVTPNYAKRNPYEGQADVKNTPTSQSTSSSKSDQLLKLKSIVDRGAVGNSIEEKTAYMKASIQNGAKKIEEVLSTPEANKKTTTAAAKKTEDETKKKSSGKSSGASGSSKKSSGGKSSGGSKSSGSKSSGSKGSAKEKTTKEKTPKAEKETKEKQEKQKTTSQKQTENKKSTFDELKETFDVKASDVSVHDTYEKMLDKLKTYENGASGYIKVGTAVYRWTKEGGQIKFEDINTGKEISAQQYLSKARSIQEFKANNKSKVTNK